MSRFTTADHIGSYDVTLEVTYRFDGPPRQCRDSGAWEGGVTVEEIQVIAAFNDDGEAADDAELAELQGLVGRV